MSYSLKVYDVDGKRDLSLNELREIAIRDARHEAAKIGVTLIGEPTVVRFSDPYSADEGWQVTWDDVTASG